MLNRRLVVLFILFVLGFCALAFRLGHLQITQADDWQKKMQEALHHPSIIETARGGILDRNMIPLAYDKASYYLAMDYRAMNHDDRWLLREALNRLKEEKFASRAERERRVTEMKARIAEEIDLIPAVIAQRCDTSELDEPSPDSPPLEKVLARFQKIRLGMHDLRMEVWNPTRKPNPRKPAVDPDVDFHRLLKDETLTHTIIPHIPEELAFYFKAHEGEYPGLCVLDSRTRVYPYKTVACQVLGTLRGADDAMVRKSPFKFPGKDAGNLGGYRAEDRVGEAGMEAVLEEKLHGILGCRIIELSVPSDDAAPAADLAVDDENAASPDRRIEPVAGKDVRLTLDISLQSDIEAALHDPAKGLLKGEDKQDHFVALVVLSLDGQVLALVSTPGYDPNEIENTRKDLNQDQYRRPLADRALQGYQPGSTVKPLMAAAALTENLITAETTVTCNGYLYPNRPNQFRCADWVLSRHVHGPLQLSDAIAHSCNIYFYTVGGRLGIERIATWLSNFGAGRETGFELPDQNGKLPKLVADPDGDLGEAMQLGIGQGPVTVTPLQMANAYATLLRSGQFISPRLLADEPAKVSQSFRISPEHLAVIKQGMRGAVTTGTGKTTFRGFKLPVGGKTGTADTSRPAFDDEGHPIFDAESPLRNADGTAKLGPDSQPMFARASTKGIDAWFVGYAPADQPKFVVAAIMEFGGYGGARAAPMVREAFLQLEKHNYLPAVDVP